MNYLCPLCDEVLQDLHCNCCDSDWTLETLQELELRGAQSKGSMTIKHASISTKPHSFLELSSKSKKKDNTILKMDLYRTYTVPLL